MSSVMYIETGMRRAVEKQRIPIGAFISKIKDFLLLAADYGKENDDAALRRARKELADVGFTRFQLDRGESHHIAYYLHEDEHIKAAIHGHVNNVGGVLMVATEARIMYLHKIPLFSNFEEFPYDIVSGISKNSVSNILSSINIFTKFKTYELDYVNVNAADQFVSYVESRIYPQDNIFRKQGRERMRPMQHSATN